MSPDQLYKDLFKNAGEHELKQIIKDHPYFSAAHFFALQQSAPGDDAYQALASKAALHFGDPLLLHLRLNNKAKQVESVNPETPGPVMEEEHIYEASAAQPIDNPHFETPEPTEEKVQAADEKNETLTGNDNLVPEAKEENEPSTAGTVKEEAPLFEPLYTTDYFASQGIKLSEVVHSGDKMGKQLKSFTEWLKTMKKIHPEGLTEKNTPSAAIDNAVQHMADKSNQEEEVVTEAMADVYLQQGKRTKAREIYKKLSLLNPSKSAYFAAKLNEIQ